MPVRLRRKKTLAPRSPQRICENGLLVAMLTRTTNASIFLAGLLLVIGKLFYDLYGAATNPAALNIANDLTSYVLPFYTYVSDSVQSGTFPLWNPYSAIGNSLVGNSAAGLFQPTNWTIFIFDDVPIAMLISQLLTILISISGAYMYSRYLGLERPARLLCIVLFGYAATVESFSHTGGATSCWFPAVMYFTHRCFDRPTLANAVFLSAILALCFVGGFANYFFYTCLIVGVFFSTLAICARQKIGYDGIARRLGLMFVSVIVMTGLIAIQLLPTYELSNLAVRNLNETLNYASKSWWEEVSASLVFANLLLPNHNYLFGNSSLKVGSGMLYLGGALLLMPFAYRSTAYRSTAIALSASALAILCVTISAGSNTLSFIYDIPVVGSLRMHSRAIVYIEFIAILLAVIGASEIASERAAPGNTAGPIVRLFWVLFPSLFTLTIVTAAIIVGRDLLAIAGLLVCSGLIIYYAIASSRISRPGILAWVVVAVVILDVTVHREHRYLIPAFSNVSNAFVEKNVRDYQSRGDYYRMLLVPQKMEDIAPFANSGPMLGIPNIGAYDPFLQARWRNFIRSISGTEKFDSMVAGSILGLFYGDFTPLLKQLSTDDRLLGLASLRYTYSDQGTAVNAQALPRAYTVHHYIKTDSEEQSLREIRANIATLHKSVILENADPSFSVDDQLDGHDETPGSAEITRYTPNEVDLAVNVAHPALVVLTDAFYPGWVAYVDGRETTIFRANSLFRAVEVPAGAHSVEFRFRPTSFYWGAAITLLTLCFSLVLVATSHHSRKRH